jgi:hypothetical protein
VAFAVVIVSQGNPDDKDGEQCGAECAQDDLVHLEISDDRMEGRRHWGRRSDH